MTVLQVAFPFAPVSLDATGGAEQVLAMLDRALAKRGDRSVVVANDRSRIEGRLAPVPRPRKFGNEARQATRELVARRIRQVLSRCDVDVVHMHGLDFYEYLPPPGIPALATLHLPPSFYPQGVFTISRPNTFLNCVSKSQHRACPQGAIKPMLVENGIPLDLFPREPARKERYALALGRICPEKGFHLALEAAERACLPLWIAGKVFPYEDHKRYFREELLPRIKAPHRYLGPVGLTRKISLLAHARCLLVTSLVPETSSLVAMEALACGTPVIAFSVGELPGLIEFGKTGFLAADPAEMAAAMAHSDQIDPKECQRQARQRFSGDRMAAKYVAVYERLINGTGSHSSTHP